jgi:hypothetical protein
LLVSGTQFLQLPHGAGRQLTALYPSRLAVDPRARIVERFDLVEKFRRCRFFERFDKLCPFRIAPAKPSLWAIIHHAEFLCDLCALCG